MYRTRLALLTVPDSYPRRSRNCLRLAAWWLQDCRDTHDTCRKMRESRKPPTRLLVLSEHRVRVCSGADIPGQFAYATLSHFWGSKTYHSLSQDNLASYRDEIPQGNLSKTVRDAIKIARELGLSYLWIDTLCIIQDSPEDWAVEASLMEAVYGGSDLNIAASGAKDGSEGCFFDRSELSQCFADIEKNGKVRRQMFTPDITGTFEQAPLSTLQGQNCSGNASRVVRANRFHVEYHR